MLFVHRAKGCGQKGFKLVWRGHQLLSGFLTRGYLPRVLRQSHLSAKDKSDGEIIPGTVHRPPDIYLKGEENPGKPQLG